MRIWTDRYRGPTGSLEGWSVAAVRVGMAQAGRGEFIEEEMDARLERMLRS